MVHGTSRLRHALMQLTPATAADVPAAAAAAVVDGVAADEELDDVAAAGGALLSSPDPDLDLDWDPEESSPASGAGTGAAAATSTSDASVIGDEAQLLGSRRSWSSSCTALNTVRTLCWRSGGCNRSSVCRSSQVDGIRQAVRDLRRANDRSASALQWVMHTGPFNQQNMPTHRQF
jgi:hypothetical protein